MATNVYRVSWDPIAGTYGYDVEYRESTSSVWIKPSSSANPTLFTYYDLALETDKTYYLRISSEGANCAKKFTLYILKTTSTTCCPGGYTLSPDKTYCYQEVTTAPTITSTNFCLATSQLATTYSGFGSLIYYPGYSIRLRGTTTALTTPYWKEATSSVTGPMNREGVWVDTDCNGTKDSLTAGSVLQITIPIESSTAKTVYVGIGGDNTFRLDVNGSTIVDCDNTTPANYAYSNSDSRNNFLYWHIFPVNIVSGTSYFTFRAVGDGSVNDAFATCIYDNTSAEIASATSNSDLNILMKTSTYRGTHIDIATCPSGYFLDTTGGSGSYTCRKVLTTSTVTC